MDADLIRLILLLLGIALVAGIWLWDRHQRRQQGVLDFDVDPEPAPTSEHEVVEEGPEIEAPEPDATLDDGEPELPPAFAVSDEPDVDHAGLEVPARSAEPSSAPKVANKPAWMEPSEPVIPAFLLNKDDESALNGDSSLDAAPVTMPDSALADAPSELAWMPDSSALTDFTPTATAEAADERPGAPAEPEPEPELEPEQAKPEPEPAELLVPGADIEPELPVLELQAEAIDAPAPRRKKPRKPEPADKAEPAADREPTIARLEDDQFDLDLGFSAVDETDLQEAAAELPQLIVQVNVVAKRGEPFSGEQIQAAMEQVEMEPGEHDIYHRFDNRLRDKQGRPRSLFSLASLVEPGNFPLKKMKDFSTPGLTLFAQLPGPRDGLLIYSDMLYAAERLARLLDARLKDDSRSALTKQTIEHTREKIAEHKRQITLKLRESNQHTRGRH